VSGHLQVATNLGFDISVEPNCPELALTCRSPPMVLEWMPKAASPPRFLDLHVSFHVDGREIGGVILSRPLTISTLPWMVFAGGIASSAEATAIETMALPLRF